MSDVAKEIQVSAQARAKLLRRVLTGLGQGGLNLTPEQRRALADAKASRGERGGAR